MPSDTSYFFDYVGKEKLKHLLDNFSILSNHFGSKNILKIYQKICLVLFRIMQIAFMFDLWEHNPILINDTIQSHYVSTILKNNRERYEKNLLSILDVYETTSYSKYFYYFECASNVLVYVLKLGFS